VGGRREIGEVGQEHISLASGPRSFRAILAIFSAASIRTQSNACRQHPRSLANWAALKCAEGARIRLTSHRCTMECNFEHLQIRTSDPDGVAGWFETMLDAEVIRSTQQGKPQVDLHLGGQNIFIMPISASESVNAAPESPHRGLDHSVWQ
jgi:hypothetical protein